MKKLNLILLFFIFTIKSGFGMISSGEESVGEESVSEEFVQYMTNKFNISSEKAIRLARASIHEICYENIDPEFLRESFCLDELPEGRALLNKVLKQENDKGETTLFCALKNTDINLNLVLYLLEKKAPLGYPNSPVDIEYKTMVKNLMTYVDEKGNTIFHYAAAYGQINLFKFLINYNADINVQNNDGKKSFELVDDHGNTILHHAAKQKSLYLVKFLIESGADHRIKNNEGLTPLAITDTRRNTLLHYAVCVDDLDTDLIKFFLNYGLDILAKNIDDVTPFDLVPTEKIANLLGARRIITRIRSLFI